jgi:hypothetical protein
LWRVIHVYGSIRQLHFACDRLTLRPEVGSITRSCTITTEQAKKTRKTLSAKASQRDPLYLHHINSGFAPSDITASVPYWTEIEVFSNLVIQVRRPPRHMRRGPPSPLRPKGACIIGHLIPTRSMMRDATIWPHKLNATLFGVQLVSGYVFRHISVSWAEVSVPASVTLFRFKAATCKPRCRAVFRNRVHKIVGIAYKMGRDGEAHLAR